jgi:hypothetical protein
VRFGQSLEFFDQDAIGRSVLLKYVQDDHSILRAVSVIKSRASYHHPDIRPFQIGGDGIVLTGSLRPPDGR